MTTDDFLRLAQDPANADAMAEVIAKILPRYLSGPAYPKYFRFWEERGFHITPNHFYQPIPDTRALSDELWSRLSELPGVDMNETGQLDLLRHAFPAFKPEYLLFSEKPTEVPGEFHFNNGYFDGCDALVLYCMIRHFKPKKIIESGSGYSTRVSARAALANGDTELVCIEPFPSEVLVSGFPGLSKLHQSKIEGVDPSFFSALEDGDILFIDTSHVVKCGGDVNKIYLEILPRLNKGVVVHIHDIFFPREYPKSWLLEEYRFWTEQYLLQAFLAFNSSFEVLFCNSYMALKHIAEMKEVFPNSQPFWGGGSFWMRKTA